MINRHERDVQATVGLAKRQIKGSDRYFDTEDAGLDIGFTPSEQSENVGEYGRKIPADQIMEPCMFQNVKTLRTWKRPHSYTIKDAIVWSKSLTDPSDWYYSALKCYATGEVECMQHEVVIRDGETRKVVVGYEEDGALKCFRKKPWAWLEDCHGYHGTWK